MKLTVLAIATMAIGGCAQQPPVPEANFTDALPAVAAEYRTVQLTGENAHEETVQWRFWRQSQRLVTENLSAARGELWQMDGKTLFHRKLFHQDHRSIEWQMDDLRMLEATPSWPRLALLVDPELIPQLKLRQAGWREGYPYRRYAGTVNGTQWDVTLRTDLMLPVVIQREQNKSRARTELVAAHAANAAPWQPTADESYEVIEFTDLGDRENDPFVMKVQRELGGWHSH